MKQVVKNISSILSPEERKKFVKLIVLDIAVSILDIAFLIALLYVVGFYTKTFPSGKFIVVPLPVLEKYPLLLITSFFFLFSLKNLFGFLIARSQFRFVYGVASRISTTALSAYLDGKYEDYITVDSSVHIRTISQQPVEFSHYVLRGVQQIISNSILILLAIIPIIIFNSTLFFLLLLTLLPPAILTIFLAKKKLASIRQSGKTNREKTMQHLQEALSGFVEINIYKRKSFFLSRYTIFQEKFNASLAELQVVQSLPARLMEVFAVFGLFILVTTSSFFGSADTVQVLLIGGFMAAAYKIIPGIVKILNNREQIKTYGFTIEDLMKRQEVTMIANDPGKNAITSIEFQNISFAYNDLKVLRNFSLKIERHDFIGLTGASGAGKTTLVNILLGFLDPTEGSVLINSKIANGPDRKTYWNKIAYSRQQPFFIHESIKTNILLGHDLQEQRLAEILSVTGINKLANQFPEGIDTMLAENGKNISGGQRQRIIMARTLYKDADLIILDEPFNELDSMAANQLLICLGELTKAGKIVVLVTHDKESLSFCNKIISPNVQ